MMNQAMNPIQDNKVIGGDRMQPEGNLTRKVELATRNIPSLVFLGVASGAIVASLTLKVMGYGKNANFVGMWVPTILLLGVYNKIVKEERRTAISSFDR